MYVNLDYLSEQVDHDPEMMKIMLDTFLETGPDYIRRVNQDFKAKDYVALRASAHAFLSSLRILGAKETAETIVEVENCCVDLDRREELNSLVPEAMSLAVQALAEAETARKKIV